MNLRIQFKAFLTQYGHNVYLQRVVNAFNDDEQEPIYENILEKHTVRSMNASRSRGLAQETIEAIEGLENPDDMVFWFQWDVNPVAGDRIYNNQPRMPNNEVIYKIDWADPKYGGFGQIAFWAVGASKIKPK